MWEGGSCHLGACVRDLAFAGEQFSPSSCYFSLAAFIPRPVVPGAARAWVSRGFIGVTWVLVQFVYCWVRIQFSWICSVITFSYAFQLAKLYCYCPLVVLSILVGVSFGDFFMGGGCLKFKRRKQNSVYLLNLPSYSRSPWNIFWISLPLSGRTELLYKPDGI